MKAELYGIMVGMNTSSSSSSSSSFFVGKLCSYKKNPSVCMCVVCVCVRNKERERERQEKGGKSEETCKKKNVPVIYFTQNI